MKVSVILVGAGLGLRMGGAIKKPFLQIHGKPIFLHTIERFAQNDKIGEIILVVGESEIKSLRDTWQNTLDTYKIKKLSLAAKDARIAYITGFARSVATPQLSLSTISSDHW